MAQIRAEAETHEDHANSRTSFHIEAEEGALLQRYGVNPSAVNTSSEITLMGRYAEKNLTVLVKRVPKNQYSHASIEAARREVAALTAISDPCVPALIEDLETNSVLAYVVESRTGMSLKMGVEAHGSLPDDAVKAIVTQLFSAVAAIFMAGYAHLRICSDTIFVDNEGRLTINDFRYAYEYSKEKSDDLYAAVSDKCGEDIYVAPEVYKSIKYNARKAVIWSCGVVVYYITTGQTERLADLGHASFDSSEASTPSPSRRKLSTATLPVIPYPANRFSVPNWARDIISKMLLPNPLRRAELIEVAAKVPKELATKETRPLMELAWLDYKSHVGPCAGLTMGDLDTSSSMFSFSRISAFSKDSLGPLLPGRRKNSLTKVIDAAESKPGKRRHTIWS